LAGEMTENGQEKQGNEDSAEPAGHSAVLNNLVHMFTKNL